jgi:hypothetical protein
MKFSVILKNAPNTTSMVWKDWRKELAEPDRPKTFSACSLAAVVVDPLDRDGERILTIL